MNAAPRSAARLGRGLLAAGLVLLGVRLALSAWVAEDAFITYRVVDNWLAGYGLRWNVDERVQVFTHPLWALLHAPLYALLGSLPVASLLLSAACLAGTLVVLWRTLELDAWRFLLGVVTPLLVSRAFGDYAISGLENPLTALLLAAFAGRALARAGQPPGFELACLFALTALNRLDSVLLLAPCLLVLLAEHRREVSWGRVALGFAPLLGWEVFSFFYYGFVLPNSKYAKLDTGIAALDLARQGAVYVLDFARSDPQSALVFGIALAVSVGALRRAWAASSASERGRARVVASLGAGLLAHGVYVVAIGGDFMRGRLFAAPLVLAVILLGCAARRLSLRRVALAAAGVVALWALAAVQQRGLGADDRYGIVDEHSVYAPHTALLDPRQSGRPSEHPWARLALEMRQAAPPVGRARVVRRGTVGLFGFYAGPEIRVIDTFALGDPLLARLPVADPQRWRIGHFWREPPVGYEDARATGDISGMDPDLGRYYEKLRFVISGPLCSWSRLLEAARFQLGFYDELRDRYLQRRREATGAAPAPGVEAALERFREANQPRYRAALARAAAWLEGVEVDPLQLRAWRLQGKKRLVELLLAYVALHAAAEADARPALMERIRDVVAITYQPAYHDMLEIDDRSFDEDATSYLAAAFWMEALGLDTELYRSEIRRSQPRFDARMEGRGAHQLLAFHWYYEHFGLQEPFPLAAAGRQGYIAARVPLQAFRSLLDFYSLTHEIMVAYRWGQAEEGAVFDDEERAYLKPLLVALTERRIARDDPDLVSELVICLSDLGFTGLPVYRRAVEFLLDSQLPDGKWGRWESFRAKFGEIVDVGLSLHSTSIAIQALNSAFQPRS